MYTQAQTHHPLSHTRIIHPKGMDDPKLFIDIQGDRNQVDSTGAPGPFQGSFNRKKDVDFIATEEWQYKSKSAVRHEDDFPCCPHKYAYLEGTITLRRQSNFYVKFGVLPQILMTCFGFVAAAFRGHRTGNVILSQELSSRFMYVFICVQDVYIELTEHVYLHTQAMSPSLPALASPWRWPSWLMRCFLSTSCQCSGPQASWNSPSSGVAVEYHGDMAITTSLCFLLADETS